MLILQRKPGEAILIGEDICITVLSADPGGRVRLAIDAPKSMSILRSELRAAMDANQAAAEEEAPPAELVSYLEQMGRGGVRAPSTEEPAPEG